MYWMKYRYPETEAGSLVLLERGAPRPLNQCVRINEPGQEAAARETSKEIRRMKIADNISSGENIQKLGVAARKACVRWDYLLRLRQGSKKHPNFLLVSMFHPKM